MNSEKNNIDMSNVINKLFEGDCLEYMKKIPDGSVDMILCDLPYGMTNIDWDNKLDLNILWKLYKKILKNNIIFVIKNKKIRLKKMINY